MQHRALKGTTDWTDASVVLDVDDDADTIAFGVLLSGTGAVDICGIRFAAVTADVPTSDAAVAGFEALLADSERVLGPDHRDTLAARAHLASDRGEAGDVAGAVAEFEALLEELRVLRADHPATLTAGAHLAYWRGEAGDATGWMMAGNGIVPGEPGGCRPSEYAWGQTGELIDGKPVVRLRSIVEKADGFGTAMQAISATRYRGERIRLSGSLRSRSIEGWAGLWLRVDGRFAHHAFDNMKNRKLKGTTDWTDASVVLDVGDDANTIPYGVLLSGKGTVDVCGIRFAAVTADVSTTDLTGVEEPINLDFGE
jgi:hypothetical protein